MSLDSMPNILFLMTDEHRFDVTGYAGNPVVRTPTLDRIAASGVEFTNAYTPSPVCVPARQCIMAGKLPSSCGLTGWDDLEPGTLTLPRHLSRHAYYTAACGKLHHEGPDQMQGWIHRIGDEMKMSPRYIDEKNDAYFERYARPFGDYKWTDRQEIQRAGAGKAFHIKMDEYTVLGAENFIESFFLSPFYDREKGGHQPLMLKVSLLQPHYPYFADEELFKYYLNRVEPFSNQELFDHPFLSERALLPGRDISPRELRRATASYYAMVETADRHFGRVIEALEAAGQNLDDWIVIYISDHGEMLGQHGVWEKQKFFEASVRVPFLISWPKCWAKGRKVDHNVNLTDLFATICDATGLHTPEGLDSRSLVPFIETAEPATIEWDNEVVSMFSKTHQPLLPEERDAWLRKAIIREGGMNLMIKRDTLKYQFYGSDLPEVLFDLEKDPAESHNLIDLPEYARAVERFRARGRRLGFTIS